MSREVPAIYERNPTASSDQPSPPELSGAIGGVTTGPAGDLEAALSALAPEALTRLVLLGLEEDPEDIAAAARAPLSGSVPVRWRSSAAELPTYALPCRLGKATQLERNQQIHLDSTGGE